LLAQNDDAPAPTSSSPNDSVASLLQFFPIRDDFYYIMVKNKGDLGAPFMAYDVLLKVQANVPVPALTPSPLIAPVVTVTSPAPPPQTPLPTTPPLPTRGATSTPTPEEVPTDTPLPDKPSPTPTLTPPGGGEPAPPTATPVPPADTPTPVIETPPPRPTPTEPPVPLPGTGHSSDLPLMVLMPVQVYVDRNGNGHYDSGEGVSGLRVVFGDLGGKAVSATTDRARGAGAALLHRDAAVSVSSPYLHWTGQARVDTGGMMIRLPQPALPSRLP
jgi:hypothetical protein